MRSTCLTRSEAIAPSRALGRIVKATSAPVALLDIAAGRHDLDDMRDLLEGRHALVANRPRDPAVLFRKLEIVGIGVGDPAAIAGLTG